MANETPPQAPAAPGILDNIKAIGGDEAVTLARLIATESALTPEAGTKPDSIGFEKNDQTIAKDALAQQLRTVLNAGIEKLGVIGSDGDAPNLTEAQKAAIKAINPDALQHAAKLLSSVAAGTPSNQERKATADALVTNGVLKHLADVPTFALQSPAPAPAAPAPAGPRTPTP